MLIELIFMEAVEPLIARDIGGTKSAKSMENGLSQGRNKPALAESSAQLGHDIDGEKLQEIQLVGIGMQRQEILTIPLRVERDSVMMCMAGGIIKRIPPAQHAKNIQENLI